jgi:hypothetical protein
MHRLNKDGLNKLQKYLESLDIVSRVTDKGFIFLSEDVDLEEHGIILKNSGTGFYEAYITEQAIGVEEEPIEDTDIETAGEESLEQEGRAFSDQELKAIAQKIAPILNEYFVTKEEANAALEELKSQMIDPQEWIEIQKAMMQKTKKASK